MFNNVIQNLCISPDVRIHV